MSRRNLLRISSQLFDRSTARLAFCAAYSHGQATTSQAVPTDAAELASEISSKANKRDLLESTPAREGIRYSKQAAVARKVPACDGIRSTFCDILPSLVPTGAPIIGSPPQSLEVPAAENEEVMSPVVGSNSPLRRVLWLMGYNSSEAVNIRAATRLYDAVCVQADTDGLHDTVDMIPVFYSRWLRAEGDNSRALQQELYDLFQEDVEVRVRQLTTVSVQTAVTDLEKSFYGTAYALDMAIAGGDEPLWRVIHRNFYGEEQHKQEAAKQLTTLLLREKKCLDMTDGEALMRGRIRFSHFPTPVNTAAAS